MQTEPGSALVVRQFCVNADVYVRLADDVSGIREDLEGRRHAHQTFKEHRSIPERGHAAQRVEIHSGISNIV